MIYQTALESIWEVLYLIQLYKYDSFLEASVQYRKHESEKTD